MIDPSSPADSALAHPAVHLPHPGLPPGDLRPEYRQPEALISADQKLVLLEHWRTIQRNKWPILGLVLVVALLAAVVAHALTPIYRASSVLLIESGRTRIVSIEDVMGSGQGREGLLTQVEVIKSRDVVEGAVRAERLWLHPAYDPRRVPDGWTARLGQLLGMASPNAGWDEDKLVAMAVTRAQTELDVVAIAGSQLIRVTYESSDAALSARMANRLAESYIANQRAVRMRAAQQANAALLDNLGQLKDKLTQSEQALQRFRDARGLVSLGGSTSTLAGQKASVATEGLFRARMRRLELEGAQRQVQSAANGDLSSVPWVMRDPAVQEAQRQVSAAKRRLIELSETLGPRNSRVQEAMAQLADSEAQLNRQSAAAADSLRREYEAAMTTEQAISNELSAVRSTVSEINKDEFQLAALEREVITNRQLYDMFVTRGKETSIAGEVQGAVARVVEQAIAPRAPVKPDRPRLVGVSAVLAGLLGCAVVLVLAALDNTLKGSDDAEARLRIPLLTALPVLPDATDLHSARAFLETPDSHFAEAIRTARTGVMLSNVDVQHKKLLVTSSVPGEGKTTLAINLALAHAQTRRTLLIDADLRRPQICRRLGLDPAAKGLSNLVAGNASLDECVQLSTEGSPLAVMTAGDMPPNPLELLLSQKFDQVLAQLQAQFDIILVDSPPVGLVSDALVLAPKMTGTIVVTKAMSTPTPLVRKSLMRLQRSGARVLGLALNALDFGRAQSQYGDGYGAGNGYGYGQGYGYGYGYGDGHAAGSGDGRRDGWPAQGADAAPVAAASGEPRRLAPGQDDKVVDV